MDQGLAVITAAILAIAGIFYTSRQQRKVARKQHTYQVLDKLNDWADFDKKLDSARQFGLSKRKLDPACATDKTDCDIIDFVLNYYEFLSSAIICGDVDEELVRRVEEERLSRAYLKFMYYISAVRLLEKAPGYWENLEFICYRWRVEKRDELERVIDGFRLRPSMSHYQARREQVRDELYALSKTLD